MPSARTPATVPDIPAIRLALQLTQAELADRLGVAKRTVTRWETGRTRDLHPVYREQLAQLWRERMGKRRVPTKEETSGS